MEGVPITLLKGGGGKINSTIQGRVENLSTSLNSLKRGEGGKFIYLLWDCKINLPSPALT
jgi:hypothetical protein